MRKRDYDETAERFLESIENVPDQPDPAQPLDDALEEIDTRDTRRHCSVMTLLTLSVIMLFFGTSLLALTNKQDFTDDHKFNFKDFASGKYLAHVESKFNGSVPLRDYLHNIDEMLHWCYGLGNQLDLINIQEKLRGEDPYSIETFDAFVPIDDSRRSQGGLVPADTDPADENEEPNTTLSDDGKHKKLSGVTLSATQTTKKDNKSPDNGNTTTTKNGPPGATTTTTVPPETSRRRRSTTEPSDTEPPDTSSTEPSDTEPSDTEPSETDPSSEPDTEPPEDSAGD